MLLMPNKKKIATIIMAGIDGGKKPDYVQRMGEESGTGGFAIKREEKESGVSEGLEAAMEDLLAAINRKDARAMARAVKNALIICDHEDDGDDEGSIEGDYSDED